MMDCRIENKIDNFESRKSEPSVDHYFGRILNAGLNPSLENIFGEVKQIFLFFFVFNIPKCQRRFYPNHLLYRVDKLPMDLKTLSMKVRNSDLLRFIKKARKYFLNCISLVSRQRKLHQFPVGNLEAVGYRILSSFEKFSPVPHYETSLDSPNTDSFFPCNSDDSFSKGPGSQEGPKYRLPIIYICLINKGDFS